MANIGGKKLFIPKPPDKGSFPLDHEAECKHVMIKYLTCLKDNQMDNSLCRSVAKQYLQCRMDKDLMAKEDFKILGFKSSETVDNNTTRNNN